MKLHIENLHVTFAASQPPAGLIAALAIAGAAKSAMLPDIPAVGEKWPGTEAVYAGVSLSVTDDSLVHLILWPDEQQKGMAYEKAVEFAEGVNRDMSSHIPTRQGSVSPYTAGGSRPCSSLPVVAAPNPP